MSAVLSDYLDGRLDASTEGTIRAHLQSCPDCQRELSGLLQTVKLLSAFEPARLSREFDAKLFARLDAVDRDGSRTRSSRWSGWLTSAVRSHQLAWRWSAAVGAAVGAAAAATFAVWQLGPIPSAPPRGEYIAACIQAHRSSAVPLREHTLLEASPDSDIAYDTD